MEIDVDARVAHLRDEIRAVDESIVDAVNRRLALVAEIRKEKERSGVPFVDRDVERRNLAALQQKNAGPLSADGLERVYREILELTKRESA